LGRTLEILKVRVLCLNETDVEKSSLKIAQGIGVLLLYYETIKGTPSTNKFLNQKFVPVNDKMFTDSKQENKWSNIEKFAKRLSDAKESHLKEISKTIKSKQRILDIINAKSSKK
jgi:hypothetical protein